MRPFAFNLRAVSPAIVFLVTHLLLCVPALAGEEYAVGLTAADVGEDCLEFAKPPLARDLYRAGECAGFVTHFIAVLEVGMLVQGASDRGRRMSPEELKKPFCFAAPRMELAKGFANYMKTTGEELKRVPASVTFYRYLLETYPCPK